MGQRDTERSFPHLVLTTEATHIQSNTFLGLPFQFLRREGRNGKQKKSRRKKHPHISQSLLFPWPASRSPCSPSSQKDGSWSLSSKLLLPFSLLRAPENRHSLEDHLLSSTVHAGLSCAPAWCGIILLSSVKISHSNWFNKMQIGQ